MTEDNGLLTRRTVLRSGAATAALTTVGAGALFYGSQSALATDYDLDGDSAEVQADENGEIESIEITPEITVEWSNLDGEETQADITIDAAVDYDEDEDDLVTISEGEHNIDLEEFDQESDETVYESGSATESLGSIDIYDDLDGLNEEEIEEIEDEETFDIYVEVTVTVNSEEDDNVGDELSSSAGSDLDLTIEGGANIDEISGEIELDAESTLDN
ncbi:twin-arginine translocation signal domain-containing protein [Natronorubrum daqingense]|uniref:Uncharacterized protein n=1 Tax=Natronorubrum daqingense TaxID=588898 RepID=A0A1N7BQ49_9EURY|nr:twin-arginine translocation signal domain-containing protein [Natronorubrum daqingense]APX96550.1 hypothetical protein BB347_07935 [Natronorubrum daqingense]SIR53396.1 hypothetical protein SAMN05421809_1301 [Natronorubrum daqingense]